MSKLLVKTLTATIKKMEKLFFSNQNMKNSPHGPSDLLLVLNCSWILTRNKVRNLRKKLLKNLFLTFQNGVKSIQTAGYNGKPTVLSGFFPYCSELPIWPKIENPYWKSDWRTLCYIYSVLPDHHQQLFANPGNLKSNKSTSCFYKAIRIFSKLALLLLLLLILIHNAEKLFLK